MTAQGESVVGHINHQRIFLLPGFAQHREHPPDACVVMRDHPVVIREVFAHDVGRKRPRRQLLVAHLELAVIKPMVGSEVLRQRNLRHIVTRAKFRGRRPRIVRRGQRDPRKKRPVPRALAHKSLRRAAKYLRRKSVAHPRGFAAPNFLQVPHRHRRVIAHPTVKNLPSLLERPQQRRQVVVPLARDKRLVARRPQSLRQRARVGRQLDFEDRSDIELRLGIGAKHAVARQQARA